MVPPPRASLPAPFSSLETRGNLECPAPRRIGPRSSGVAGGQRLEGGSRPPHFPQPGGISGHKRHSMFLEQVLASTLVRLGCRAGEFRGHISFLGHLGSSPVLLTWSRHQAPTGPQPGSQVGILKCVEPEAVPVCTPTVLGSSDHPHPTMADLQSGKPGRPPCVHQPPPQGASPFSASLFPSAWLGLLLSATQGLTLFPSGGGSAALVPPPQARERGPSASPRGGISRRKSDVIALVSSLQKEATETCGDGQRGARLLTELAPH